MTILDRSTLDFFLYGWLGAEEVLSRPAFSEHNRESVNAMLDTAARIAESHFLPFFKKGDREEPYQDADGAHVIPETRAAIAAYAEAGFAAAPFPVELGRAGGAESRAPGGDGVFHGRKCADGELFDADGGQCRADFDIRDGAAD